MAGRGGDEGDGEGGVGIEGWGVGGSQRYFFPSRGCKLLWLRYIYCTWAFCLLFLLGEGALFYWFLGDYGVFFLIRNIYSIWHSGTLEMCDY